MAKARNDFSDLLVRDKVLSNDQLEEARSMQEQSGAKLQDVLVKMGYCGIDQAMRAFAEFNKLDYVDLTDRTVPASVVELVPESIARENIIFAVEMDGNALKIVMSDPTNYETITKLQFILNKDIIASVAAREQIIEAINRHYGQTETESVDSMLAEFTDTAIDFTDTEGSKGFSGSESGDNEAPIIRLVNLMIQEAVNSRASDIHIEPFAERIRVRYRIDGVLQERDNPPRRLLAPL
ncbi:MAG: type II/IV secretion system protein, partial [Planctomycetota bacterium]